MFEIELKNDDSSKNLASEKLSTLRKIVEGLTDIVEQMEVKCDENGLSIQVMDPMHVALADVYLSKKCFTNYRCDRNLQLGIPTKNFLAVLRGINLESESLFRMSCEDTPQVLKIEHILPNSQCEFDITLYNIGTESYTVPVLDYQSKIVLPSEQFKNVFKPIGLLGEYISFECEDHTLKIKQNGDLIKNSMSLKADKSDEGLIISAEEPVKLEIAMKYVAFVNKVSSLSSQVKINLSNLSPVFFEIDMIDNSYVKFYVMPRAD